MIIFSLFQIKMSLTGIILDVSASMHRNIESGIAEPGGPLVQPIFKVIDDLIKHDLTSEHQVFAIGVGASCTKEIFDIIGTLKEIENVEMPIHERNTPATENHINEILDILEGNGASNTRQWIQDITFIQDELSDCMAALILKKLESDKEFLSKFVHKFLPKICRDSATWRIKWQQLSGLYKTATKEEIREVVDKAKCYFLKDVEKHSIFSVQDASHIIRKYFNGNELITERMKELLENVEPFIFGQTPLCASLEKATRLFEGDKPENCKSLFVLSDGRPTDGSIDDNGIKRQISKLPGVGSKKVASDDNPPDEYNQDNSRLRRVTSRLAKAGVKVVSCFVTKSTNIQPKRLYDEIQPDWEPGAKFMFSLSSHVPTQYLTRAILDKRGWKIDIANNETKLFIQVNHPENLR